MSSYSDTATALSQRTLLYPVSSKRGDEESVFEGAGEVMDRHLSMAAGDAPGSDPAVSKIPTLTPASRGPGKSAGAVSGKVVQSARPQQRGDGASRSPRTLTDAQVLKVLEDRHVGTGVIDRDASGADVAVLPPEDTDTRLVLREAVARNTPVFFAVQLQWSVQPIDAKSIPGHPIFHAYTLYAAEGRRAGRTWFFLRLGFFSDAVSAKQVAHYLRRDFASAAVVPVSPQERHQVRGKWGVVPKRVR